MIADPRRRLVVAGCLAAGLFASMPQSHAHAAAAVDVDSVVVTGGTLRLALTASGLPGGADPSAAVVHVDGTRVEATVSGTSGTSGEARTVVLVVDTSGSMTGAPLTAARSAALSFLTRVAPDVKVGLIGFSDQPRLIVAPSTDRAGLRRGISSLHAAGQTTLYDGVALALRVAGAGGARQVVVLSDGADTRSRTSLQSLMPRIVASGDVLNAIGFRTSDAQSSVLAALARAGKGQLSSVGAVDGLAAAFAAAAQPMEHLVVTAPLPNSAAGHDVVVQVQIPSRDDRSAATVRRTVHVPTALVASKPRRAPAASASTRLPVAGLVALAVGLFLLVLGIAGWARPMSAARRRGKVLAGYSVRPSSRPPSGQDDPPASVAHRLLACAARVLARTGDGNEVALRLDQAGLSLSAAEWRAVRVGVALCGSVLAVVATKSLLALLIAAPVLGMVLPHMWLARRIRKRREAFIARLPDALQLVASSLSAGYSLPQALDALVQQGVHPVSDEFGRALSDTRLGVPIEDALDGVAVRVADPDFEWTVMAIRIQREVGGNLAEVLTTVGQTLRERAGLRRQVKVLSAEGRLSAIILMSLPILLALFELTFRRAYMRPLYTTKIGVGMLVFAVVTLTAGGAWMRKIVKVEA